MTDIVCKIIDNNYIHVEADSSVRQELSDFFSFFAKNYQWMQNYKRGRWDGKIRLYNMMKHTLPAGLIDYIHIFARERNYIVDDQCEFPKNEFSEKEAQQFATSLKLNVDPRDYQMSTFTHCVRERRALVLSPTASGKSLMIYMLARYFKKKTLLIVPTINLVDQMKNDFIEYGMKENQIHTITAGAEKESDAAITVSTWQSIYKMPPEYFSSFELLIGDECHLFQASSLTSIVNKMPHCDLRFGFTGTLDGSECHRLVTEGLFGRMHQSITIKEMMDQKYSASLMVKCVVLKYKKNYRKKRTYPEEIELIRNIPERNHFIAELVRRQKGTTLVLFNSIEHGETLYDCIKNLEGDRRVFLIHGGVAANERERIRTIANSGNDVVIVASYGTYSTGVNIPSIRTCVFAFGYKSLVRNLQSIGRNLRLSEGKSQAIIFDIADDMKTKNFENYSLTHFRERVIIYSREGFDYEMHSITLKELQ